MHHRMLLQADCLLLQLLLFILSLSMDGLRVGTLNMNGWRDKQKRVRVAGWLRQRAQEVGEVEFTREDTKKELIKSLR